jgi:CheY-like chemotaxis protein
VTEVRAPAVLVVEDNAELASLLTTGIEELGYRAVVAKTGAAAMSALSTEHPAAAVVDLLLPDMLGTEVLAALAAPPAIPSIAVTGVFKGARYATEAKERYRVRAYFEKPFQSSALFEALGALLGRSAPAPAEDVLPAADIVEDSEPEIELTSVRVDSGPIRTDPPSAVPGVPPEDTAPRPAPAAPSQPPPAPARAAPAPAPGLAPASLLHGAALRPSPAADPAPAARVARANTPAAAAAPAAKSAERAAGGASAPLRHGNLAETSVPRLLTACFVGQETGALRLRQGKAVKTVYVKRGMLAGAVSNLASERFPAVAIRRGKIPSEKVGAVAAAAVAEGQRTGEAMVAAGILNKEAHRLLVGEQTREILWSTFDWLDGDYDFRPLPAAPAWLLPVLVRPGDAVLEGLRRKTQVETLQKRLSRERTLAPAPDPAFELHDLPLDADEAMLLASCNGTRNVGELVRMGRMDERRTLALLYALEALGVLGEASQVMASQRRVGLL